MGCNLNNLSNCQHFQGYSYWKIPFDVWYKKPDKTHSQLHSLDGVTCKFIQITEKIDENLQMHCDSLEKHIHLSFQWLEYWTKYLSSFTFIEKSMENYKDHTKSHSSPRTIWLVMFLFVFWLFFSYFYFFFVCCYMRMCIS